MELLVFVEHYFIKVYLSDLIQPLDNFLSITYWQDWCHVCFLGDTNQKNHYCSHMLKEMLLELYFDFLNNSTYEWLDFINLFLSNQYFAWYIEYLELTKERFCHYFISLNIFVCLKSVHPLKHKNYLLSSKPLVIALLIMRNCWDSTYYYLKSTQYSKYYCSGISHETN